MSDIFAVHSQLAMSLVFHINFSTIGVALPLALFAMVFGILTLLVLDFHTRIRAND
jgi:hypothetical protein